MEKNKKSLTNEQKGKAPFSILRKGAIAGLLGLTMCVGCFGFSGCSDGKDGQNGRNGSQWYSGTANIETVTMGENGDFYFDTDDYKVYQKENGNWVLKMENFGKPGTNGQDGQDGQDGQTPNLTINANGYWVINGIATEVKAKGENGQNGQDGQTPTITISTDGYWVIDGITTQTKAEAINGTNGQDGNVWFVGTEYPTNPRSGDIFLNNSNWQVYQYNGESWDSKGNIKGATGQDGVSGENGTTWYSGDVDPTNEGLVGDYYLNTKTYDVFKKDNSSWNKIGNIKGKDGLNGSSENTINNAGYMHISFDDIEICLNNLKNSNYSSIYEEPFLKWLKTMHDDYGAKFSLYAYNDVLNGVPNTYASEFFEAKDWLKIGLHATNSGSNFASTSYETGKNIWNSFVNNIVRITGSYLSVDRVPRLHMFAGSEDALKGMRDANYGALGFLSADDTRNSYYFDDETKMYLYDNDHITDHKNGLIFVATDLRTDWFDGTSASYTYKKPTKTNVYDELVERYTNVNFANSTSSYILFGHEWKIYNGTTITDIGKQYYEDACRFANEYSIAFDYSQNKAFNPTPYDIYPSTTKADSGDEGNTNTTTFAGETLTIVDSFDKVNFANGYTINGEKTYVELTARAVSKTEVLKVNNKMKVLSLDLSKLSIGDKLQYTVFQFSSIPLDNSTILGTSGVWTQEDVYLDDATKYIMIGFKNDAGVAFTNDDIALLNSCITFSSKASSGITYYGRTLIGTTDISQMSFTAGRSVNGNATGDFSTSVGRAACIDMALEVNGGETLTFVGNLQEILGTTNLAFAVVEFSGAPLSSSTLSNSNSNEASGMRWLTSAHKLQSNTKYVLIAFKNGDGTKDFTAEQLEKLNQCLTLTSGE